MKVITRFPPSPTGNLHIGGARTALFNFLFARHSEGKIYLRLENTDEARSRPEFEQSILDSLSWLGLECDALPDGRAFWRQSERREVYRSYLKKLVEEEKAYVSKEAPTPHPNGSSPLAGEQGGEGRRAEVIRFKNPNKKIAFDDLIRGRIEFDTTELGDMVIAKSLDEPLYHLAVVIDDHEMGVTHVIRGEDHISNTPRQMLLQEALGLPRPQYAHIPLILAPDRSKLSKRHGAVSVTEYRGQGYLPEALLNYLALLGWNPGDERELFSLDELVREFDISKVQKGGAIFDEEKLRWMNREYLKGVGRGTIIPHLPPTLTSGRSEGQIQALADMFLERVSTLGEIARDVDSSEFSYLIEEPEYEASLLKWERATEVPKAHLEKVFMLLGALSEAAFTRDNVKNTLMPYAVAKGKGNVLWPFRAALTGKKQSPDPFTVAAILGKERTLARVKKALVLLSA